MRVLHAQPGFAPGLRVLNLPGVRGRRVGFGHGPLRFAREPGDQRVIRGRVGGVGAIHLVHRHARAVEELQAVAPVLLDRPGRFPRGEEHAQIDVRSQHQAHRTFGLNVLIHAVALVHTPVVAGQRHDLAQRAEFAEDLLRRSMQRGRLDAGTARGHPFGLGHAQRLGQVAGAQPGLRGGQGLVAGAQFFSAGREIGIRHRRPSGRCQSLLKTAAEPGLRRAAADRTQY
ncbi:hypothetical protein D3C72_1660950 [compost metagenome]